MSLDLADTSTFQREWTLLLECASPFTDPTRFTDLAKTVDWPRLLFLADEHGLVGHVTAVLQKLNAGAIPAQVTKDLLDRQRAQALSSLRMTAELFRILEQFAAAGVRALAVKGPVLSVQAYGDPAMRSYGDLDLLVPHRDIRSATELMLASGYEARVSLKAIGAGKIPGQYLFCKPDSKLLVELHNDRTLRYFPRPLPMEQFFARRIRVPLDAREAPALCVEDELILISIHGAKHFWERLIWIADVAALMTRQSSLDWERVLATAEELRATRMLYTGLQLAVDLLKARLPEAIRAKTKGDHVAAQLARQIFNWLPAAGNAPPGLMERALFRVRMRGGLFSGPTYLLRLSLSPTEEDWRAKDQQTTSHFLDALRRPFRLARKHSSGRNP
jgi:hypothetical protein